MKRRKFLQASGAISVPLILNGFKLNALASSGYFNSMEENDKVLVLIRLDGGNDGLNMIIPKDQYSGLAAVRSNIMLPENSILDLSDTVAIHPSMTGAHSLFQEGKMNVIQSVGYPNQNRSHFRSTDIWTSGSPADETWKTGWLGRYLEERHPEYPENYPNNDDPHPFAITMGRTVSETCQGTAVNFSLTLNDPFTLAPLTEGAASDLPDTPYGEELDFLRTSIRQSNAYGEVITTAAESGSSLVDYPADSQLAGHLKNVTQLISGGLETKIYVVSLGGFDTHANQVDTDTSRGNHAELLQTLSDAMASFQADLAAQGLEDRVISMTFTEFGRRIRSNESGGTDHGTAAPLLMWGSCVNPTIFGDNPEISADAEVGDGVPMQYDFRDVYGSVLKDWFGVEETEIRSLLYEDFTVLPLINCSITGTQDVEQKVIEMSMSPNPCSNYFNLNFESENEWVKLSIYDAIGFEVKRVFNKKLTAGLHQVNVDMSSLPAGTYFCRLQMGASQKTKRILKV